MVATSVGKSVWSVTVAIVWSFVAGAARADEPRAEGAPADIDPVTRARLMAALLAIVILGIGLVVMTMMAARMVRRWTRYTPPPLAPLRKKAPPQPPPDEEFTTNDDASAGEQAD
ncbi:MAG: hypothetical protein HYX69_05870 [Planctomycetia bacterium]|nr:hypothetical protein [Planctomycetia bacterium]